MRVFSVVLLIFVGVVFVTTPAQVLKTMFAPNSDSFYYIAIVCIIGYYILATLLPIDKLIGRIYPIFGVCLLIMAIGMTFMMFFTGEIRNIPEFAFANLRPDKGDNIMARLFPFLFITIACGAISGFHATQAPLMARCMKNEKEGRMVFYGAMILEGIIAMIWAAVTMAHFEVVGVETAVAAPVIVTNSSLDYMGWVGGILAVFGVVACPITSGDTAFRSARLTLADIFKFDQKPIKNRLFVAIPLFVVGVLLVLFSLSGTNNFNIIWRYFAWSNQTLAAIALWAISAYLAKTGKLYWFTLLPAAFMTVVVTSYFFTANECLGPMMTKITGSAAIAYNIGICIGLILSAALLALFIPFIGIKQKGTIKE
jgi:carbon starvation protein CstA